MNAFVITAVWEKIRETKDKDRWQADNEVCSSPRVASSPVSPIFSTLHEKRSRCTRKDLFSCNVEKMGETGDEATPIVDQDILLSTHTGIFVLGSNEKVTLPKYIL